MYEYIAIALVLAILAVGIVLNVLAAQQGAELSRMEKRHATVMQSGKQINVLSYLKNVADKMPEMRHKTTGLPINHFGNLKRIYMHKGDLKHCNKYIKNVSGKALSEAKKKGAKVIRVKI